MRRTLITLSLVVVTSAAFSMPLASTGAAAAATNWPIKIYSVSTPPTKVAAALADPYVSGISTRFSWSRIEPSPGTFDWSPIDAAIAQARSAGKKAMIRVMAGMYTPSWVLAQVKTLTFSNQYLWGSSAALATIPVPWDPAFLSLWKGFITAMGARYDGNATIYSVQMAGGGMTGEMTLPNDVQTWLRAGYSDAKYIGSWQTVIDAYRTAFPRTPINLDVTEPFGSSLTTNVASPLASYATASGPKKAWIQSNGLRAGMLGSFGPYRTIIRAASSVTVVGYQMIGDAKTAQDLKDSFQVAVEDHVGYVEVYGSDVLDAGNQTALHYLASGGVS